MNQFSFKPLVTDNKVGMLASLGIFFMPLFTYSSTQENPTPYAMPWWGIYGFWIVFGGLGIRAKAPMGYVALIGGTTTLLAAHILNSMHLPMFSHWIGLSLGLGLGASIFTVIYLRMERTCAVLLILVGIWICIGASFG